MLHWSPFLVNENFFASWVHIGMGSRIFCFPQFIFIFEVVDFWKLETIHVYGSHPLCAWIPIEGSLILSRTMLITLITNSLEMQNITLCYVSCCWKILVVYRKIRNVADFMTLQTKSPTYHIHLLGPLSSYLENMLAIFSIWMYVCYKLVSYEKDYTDWF